MSQENVERARPVYDALNRRDLDTVLAFMDPEIEFTARIVETEGSPSLRGHEGIREWWRTLLAVFPDYSVEPLEIRDFGDSMIVALRIRGHGVDSGVPFDETMWQAIELREGKAIWWRACGSEGEALEAAGLSE